jgi:hypothetical protein
MAWEIVFMLVVLKIPIIYLCVVIWWAIREEPTPSDPVAVAVVVDTPPLGGSGSPRRRRSPRPKPTRPHVPGRAGGSPVPLRDGVRP